MPGSDVRMSILALGEILEGGDALLEQQVGLRITAVLDHRHGLRESHSRDLAHLRLALDVDPPAGQLHRETHVLAPRPIARES